MSKTFIKHDQISEIDENQHHDKKHDLSSTKDHHGYLDEKLIKYSKPTLHNHPEDQRVKVKTTNSKTTKPHSIIEFSGTGIIVNENLSQDKIIVELPAGGGGTTDHASLTNL